MTLPNIWWVSVFIVSNNIFKCVVVRISTLSHQRRQKMVFLQRRRRRKETTLIFPYFSRSQQSLPATLSKIEAGIGKNALEQQTVSVEAESSETRTEEGEKKLRKKKKILRRTQLFRSTSQPPRPKNLSLPNAALSNSCRPASVRFSGEQCSFSLRRIYSPISLFSASPNFPMAEAPARPRTEKAFPIKLDLQTFKPSLFLLARTHTRTFSLSHSKAVKGLPFVLRWPLCR